MGHARNAPVASRLVVLLAVFAVITAACAGAASEPLEGIEDALIEETALFWVNALGLVQLDAEIWRSRLGEACEQGVWGRDVAEALAAKYVEEDESVSARPEEMGPPAVDEAARTLWVMAVQVCRDSFPEGSIGDGPPFGVGG